MPKRNSPAKRSASRGGPWWSQSRTTRPSARSAPPANQALFRAVNEKIKGLNEAFTEFAGSFAIACECADTSCIETLELPPDEYEAIRAAPRHFAVLPGHIYPYVEDVVRESNGYVVVEKTARAASVAEILDPRRAE